MVAVEGDLTIAAAQDSSPVGRRCGSPGGKRVAGVPLFAIKAMARHVVDGLGRLARRDIIGATRHEMMAAYYAGFAWEDWRLPVRPGSLPGPTRQRTPE